MGGTKLSPRRRTSRLIAVLATMALVPLVAVIGAPSAGATVITSPGPLTSIETTNTLACQVFHTGDASGQFFGASSCGTFASVDGQLYGWLGTQWANVVQQPVSGAGTAASPYLLSTTASAALTGVHIHQVDSYVTGEESFRTDVSISNTSGVAKTVRLYRAADCYLQGSDTGLGLVDPATGAVACKSATTDRIEQWFPITPGSHYMEDHYSTVYGVVTSQQPFPDACTCEVNQDNGMGLSWDVTVPASQTTTVSSIVTFSPLGNLPLSTTKTADSPTIAPGGSNGYTITVQNPNVGAVSLNNITDALPSGFFYVEGSSTGATTTDPVATPGLLTWNGPFSVPGSGSLALHFGVGAGAVTDGIKYNNAGADAVAGFTVAPTGPTAPITVSSSGNLPLTMSKTASASSVPAGGSLTYTITIANPNASSVTVSQVSDVLPDNFLYAAGSTTGAIDFDPNASDETSLGWLGEFPVPGSGSISFSFGVNVFSGAAAGTYTNSASGLANGGFIVNGTGETAPVTVTGEPPADPLVVSLAPLTGSNPVNSSHTVTATVSRGSVPQAGVAVSFAVVSGPNVELTGSGTTNASGQASFAYSSELAGTDTIQASVFDSPFETTRTSNTVTKTWTVSNVQLEVASTTEPETVTRGGFVRQTYVISNTGTAGATGVDFAVALPAGASVFSNTTSQGSCVALSGALSCALGSIAPGGSVTVVAVLQVPAAFPPGPFQTTVSTSSDQTDSQSGAPPAPADVIVPAPGMAFGYVPPGGTLRTAATATPADNTVAAFTLPGYGGGAPISLIAEPTTATFCGGLPCTGKVFELSTFEGYYDPARPPRLELIYDRSIYGRGQHSTVYVLKENQVTPSKVRECKPNPAWGSLTPPKHRSRHWKPDFRPLLSKLLSALGFGPWSGYASPSPCVNKKWTDHQGDVHFEILVLSGDPRFARR